MMHKTFRFLFPIIFFSFTLCANATVSFKLIPRTNVISGKNFQITMRLTVEDENLSNVSMPQAPQLDGCRLLSGPNQTTSQQQTVIINGRQSSSSLIDLTCTYQAGAPGKVRIPPVSINIGGRTYSTSEAIFEILPPDADTPSSNSPSISNTPGHSSRQASNDFFVRVIFSKSSIYEQEGFIAITKLYRPANSNTRIQLQAIPRMPVYEGFLSEELDPNPDGQIENYNGRNYITYELSRVLLFPQRAGNLTVTSGSYTLNIQEQVGVINMRGFPTARYEDYTYTTPVTSASIAVKELPQPRPADFFGAVGQYSVSASIAPDNLRTNESATYTLTFRGTGNVKFLTIPHVDFPATFDQYTPKTDIHASVSGQTFSGSYSVDFPLVPQEVGHYDIPAQTFSYFDLSKKEYVTLSVPVLPVDVQRGAAVAVSNERQQIDTSIKDIMHIHSLPVAISPAASPVFTNWFFWFLWIIGIVILIVSIVLYRHRIKRAADVVGRKNARANRVVSKRFKTASAYMKSDQVDKFYEELARALKGYLSDKLAMPPSSLISSTISERLAQYGVSDADIRETINVLDGCELARFTPDKSQSAMNEMLERAISVIKSIENVKK